MPSFTTTPEEKEKLLTDGFVSLPGAVPPNVVEHWRDLADKFESAALEAHSRSERLHGACVIEDRVGPRLMRQDDLPGIESDAALDLLACPGMLAVARDLCGRGTVPLQMDLLYKHQHPHPVILWHQGAQHPRGFPYLNVGIYLDDADEGDGCLKHVPGTQHELQDICSLAEEHGWDVPDSVEQPAKAGDILVQDMMILHGSAPKWSPGPRRTIYVELRPAAGILESAKQSERWAELRKRWMGLVLRRTDSSEWPEQWREDLPSDLASDEEEIRTILENWEPPIPAFYCPRNVETDNYPVPSSRPDAD